MEGCGMNCIKYLLVLFNGLFLVFGIVIVAAACVDITWFAGMEEVSGHETDAVLIAIGVLIIVIAAFGCFGAWKESPKLLYIYAGCFIVIVLLELSVGIAAAVLRPQMEDTMKTQFRVAFIKNKSNRDEDYSSKELWDRIQSSFECCGVTGPENYATVEPLMHPSLSCCPPQNKEEETDQEIYRANCLSEQKYYRDGCEDKVLATIHSAGLTVIVCGILFCFLEVAGIILALRLAHSIKNVGKSREKA